MVAEKQGFWKKHIEPKMGVSIFVLLLGGGTGAYLTYEKDKLEIQAEKNALELRVYPSPQRLIKAMEHDDEVPSDVENFQREIRLIKTGDTLVEFQKEINEQIKVIDSFYQFAKASKISDSLAEFKRQKSRDSRDSTMNETLQAQKVYNQNQINVTNAINALTQTVKKLDTTQ